MRKRKASTRAERSYTLAGPRGMRLGWRKGSSVRPQDAPASEGDADTVVQQQPPHPTRRRSLRAGLAVLGGRTAGTLSRRLHVGGGTSIVGLVAQRVDPGIVGRLATQLEHGSVLVSGTNGKTTSSGFIASILSEAGLRVWRNREGSNLMGGIASSLVIRALPNGNLRRAGKAISIFEVDEAVVPQALRLIPPRVAVFINLLRDQLDRYGEVDSVAARWQQAIRTLAAETILVLNADDPATADLGQAFGGRVVYFGIDDAALDLSRQQSGTQHHQVIDSRTCSCCGSEYTYTLRFFSHMGHYECPNCGHKRPEPDVRLLHVQADDFDSWRLHVATSSSPTQPRELVIPLPGIYNVYNALAAVAAAQALEVGWDPIASGLAQFKPIFGRGERIEVEGRTLRLLLAKNPTGFNEVLRTLFSEGTSRHVLFALNDNVADGRDISWIWDVDFERVVEHAAALVLTGTRALDLALRLKYAGLPEEKMLTVPAAPLRALRRERVKARRIRTSSAATAPDQAGTDGRQDRRYGIEQALDIAVQQTPLGETLFVVPTYTGLLALHRELERRGLTPRYWEGRDG
jgi:lipid II isoglutaminyl synthase (glutamine-hydrolysing)